MNPYEQAISYWKSEGLDKAFTEAHQALYAEYFLSPSGLKMRPIVHCSRPLDARGVLFAIVNLHLFGMSDEDIAKGLGCPVECVRSMKAACPPGTFPA